jgi:hypothetical protein
MIVEQKEKGVSHVELEGIVVPQTTPPKLLNQAIRSLLNPSGVSSFSSEQWFVSQKKHEAMVQFFRLARTLPEYVV